MLFNRLVETNNLNFNDRLIKKAHFKEGLELQEKEIQVTI